MPGDLIIVKNLKIRRSDVQKVLKYMRELRKYNNKLRLTLIDIKSRDELWKAATGRHLCLELIQDLEKNIASIEKEMEGLRKALEKIMQAKE